MAYGLDTLIKTELSEGGLVFWNYEDNATVLDILVRMGYSPNQANPDAMTSAAMYGLTNTLAFLLAEGSIDPNEAVEVEDEEYLQDPPLGMAAANGQVEAVKLLLADPRVDPSGSNEYGGNSPIWLAAEAIVDDKIEEYLEIVLLLLKRVDPSEEESHILIVCSQSRDNPEMMRLLLSDPRVNPSDNESSCLRYAVTKGREQTVAVLLEDGRAQHWAQNGDALIEAVKIANVVIAKMSLDNGRVDPNVREGYALLEAIRNEQNEVAETLLADDRTYVNDTILRTVINNIEAMEMLLAREDTLEILNESHLAALRSEEMGNLIRDSLARK